MKHDDFIIELRQLGWPIVESRERGWGGLSKEVSAKLACTSDEFRNFIDDFSVLANPEDNVWFLSFEDYSKQPGGEGFAWNEFDL